MPPELPYCHSLVARLVRSINTVYSNQKHYERPKKMNFPKKRIIPILVLILVTISMIRIVLITVTTYSSISSSSHSHSPTAFSSILRPNQTTNLRIYPNLAALTAKEFQLLVNLVAHRAPCNLLIFGLEPEYLYLSSINEQGYTVFLEDDPDKILNTTEANSSTVRIYKVKYDVPSKEGYKILSHARRDSVCSETSRLLKASKCRLALKNLPMEVYELDWDVVVVDGPSGASPEAPGRMTAIYTTAVVARRGGVTDVVVHDVDRTIERWFSWEFLCDENLVMSKGKLWHFRINGQLNSTEFCHSTPVMLV